MSEFLPPCKYRGSANRNGSVFRCRHPQVHVADGLVTAAICRSCRQRALPETAASMKTSSRAGQQPCAVNGAIPPNLSGNGDAASSAPRIRAGGLHSPGASDVASRCDAIVKSFRRFGSLSRLVDSLRHFYPGIRILIADDSFENPADGALVSEIRALQRTEGVDWHQLPFDSGLAFARNFLVRQSTKPFIVNLDDDYVITEETRLEHMLAILDAEPGLGVVTGLVRHDGRTANNWAGHFHFVEEPNSGRRLVIEPLNSEWREAGGVRYRRTDLGWNAYAARRDVLLKCPCDERLKVVGEHLDHFLSMHAQGIAVACTPDVIFGHLHTRPTGYLRYRNRKGEFFPRMLSKWGLRNPPNHLMQPEPGIPVRSVQEMWRRQQDVRPNLVVFGVGHSGTTILTKMLIRLGWSAGPADDEYGEHVPIRRLNDIAWRTGKLDRAQAQKLLDELPAPWIIKDPRFVNTIGRWMPIFETYQPCLLWIVRDPDEVKRSYRRRGEGPVVRGLSLDETFRMAEEAYRQWPWTKLRMQYEHLQAAIELFDVDWKLRYAALKECP